MFIIKYQDIIIWLIFSLLITYILIIIYPYPYYSQEFQLGNSIPATYDSTSDYLSEIFSVYLNGFPMDFLHPGLPIKYFSSYIYSFFKNINSIEDINTYSRFYLIFSNLLCIFISSRIILRHDVSYSFFILSVFLLYPSGFIFFDDVSANAILFGLSLLLISIGYTLTKSFSYSNIIIFSLLLGFSISMKYTMVILLIPLLFSLPFLHSKKKKTNLIINIFIISFFTLISLIIFFVYPIIPFIPFFLTQLNFLSFIIDLVSKLNIFYLSIFLIFLIFFFILTLNYYSNLNLNYQKVYRFICLVIFILFILFSLIKMSFSDSYPLMGTTLRNYLPILGFFIIFLPKKKNIILKYKTYFILPLMVVSLFLKINYNISANSLAIKKDSFLNEIINNFSSKYDTIVFYPLSNFTSKNLVLVWGDYRYGDRKKSFLQDEGLKNLFDPNIDKIKILNSRHFDLDDKSNTFAYKYFTSIINNKFTSDTQKKIASNQIYLLEKKDMCKQLYSDFKIDDNFIILLPYSLDSFYKNNEIHSTNYAKNYVKKFINNFNKKCDNNLSFDTYIKNDQLFYLVYKVN